MLGNGRPGGVRSSRLVPRLSAPAVVGDHPRRRAGLPAALRALPARGGEPDASGAGTRAEAARDAPAPALLRLPPHDRAPGGLGNLRRRDAPGVARRAPVRALAIAGRA